MKYQDFVIKDGRFIGKFEEMYKKFPDPWQLLKNNSNSQNASPQGGASNTTDEQRNRERRQRQ